MRVCEVVEFVSEVVCVCVWVWGCKMLLCRDGSL